MFFSENLTREQRGSKPGRMHDRPGIQLHPLRHVSFSLPSYHDYRDTYMLTI